MNGILSHRPDYGSGDTGVSQSPADYSAVISPYCPTFPQSVNLPVEQQIDGDFVGTVSVQESVDGDVGWSYSEVEFDENFSYYSLGDADSLPGPSFAWVFPFCF